MVAVRVPDSSKDPKQVSSLGSPVSTPSASVGLGSHFRSGDDACAVGLSIGLNEPAPHLAVLASPSVRAPLRKTCRESPGETLPQFPNWVPG